jgi:hypothetical protein
MPVASPNLHHWHTRYEIKDLSNVNEVWAQITGILDLGFHFAAQSKDYAIEYRRFMKYLGMLIISAQQSKSEQHHPDESEYIKSQIYQYFSSYLTRAKV